MKIRLLLTLLLPAVLIIGCDQPDTQTVDDPLAADTAAVDQQQTARTAVAELEPTEGNDVRGTVTFTEEGDGIRVVATVTGLTEGAHGFHVHEVGDCSAPDASSAGGHFNPTNATHGGPDDAENERHVGDLGNIEADETGSAEYDRIDRVIAFDGTNSIIGKSVIVHSDEDDLETDPTGNAGDRLACGVIENTGGGMQQSAPGTTQPDTTTSPTQPMN